MCVSTERATKLASAASATASGLSGKSIVPYGDDLVTLPNSRRRASLALGQTVDPVVEQDDLQVHVAAQHVEEVVAADPQRVAVAGDHPDPELRPRRLQAVAIAGARPWMLWKPYVFM